MTSERVNKLQPPAEVFYRRLMSVVDDFGRYYAKPDLLRAALYPLRLDTVRNADIGTWIECAREAGLLVVYSVDGKEFLELCDFRQHARAKVSKFPQPPADAVQMHCMCDANAMHVQASAPVYEGEGVYGKRAKAREKVSFPEGWKPKPETVTKLSREFGLRVPEDVDRYVAAFEDICRSKDYRYVNFDAAFSNCVRQDWPKLRKGGKVIDLPKREGMVM